VDAKTEFLHKHPAMCLNHENVKRRREHAQFHSPFDTPRAARRGAGIPAEGPSMGAAERDAGEREL
jgi:hypothetical protein